MGPSTAKATVAGNCNLQRATGAAATTSIKTDQVDRRQAQQKNETARDSGQETDGGSVCVCVWKDAAATL